MARKRVGDLFAEKKLLTPGQAQDVAEFGRTQGIRFGEAAVQLGLVSREVLGRLFGANEFDFFYLDYRYFPADTRDVFSVEFMLRNGVVGLGCKREFRYFRPQKMLNLGFLFPTDSKVVEMAEKLGRERMPEIGGFRPYLVFPEQLAECLREVFKVTPAVALQQELHLALRDPAVWSPVVPQR